MVTVYSVKVRDGRTQHTVTAEHKRTREGAKLLGAEIALETAQEVDEADIDTQGRYMPKTSIG